MNRADLIALVNAPGNKRYTLAECRAAQRAVIAAADALVDAAREEGRRSGIQEAAARVARATPGGTWDVYALRALSRDVLALATVQS